MKQLFICLLLINFLSLSFAGVKFFKNNNKKNFKTAPLKGKALKFSDSYGALDYRSDVIKYTTRDHAKIEATLITPEHQEINPGIIFVHMWARDRETYWGLPQFLATHGYTSIAMDLRGHGNSSFPKSAKKITLKDKSKHYASLYLDILPAIDILNNQKHVQKNHLILIGASLGSPLGIIAASKHSEKFIGMINLSPAIVYFDVNCRTAMKVLHELPLYVIAESTDSSFRSGKQFFNLSHKYKTFFKLDHIAHGSDIFYYDLGFPTLILNWIKQIECVSPLIKKINHFRN